MSPSTPFFSLPCFFIPVRPVNISKQRCWYWFGSNLRGCLSILYTTKCRVCCGFSSSPGWGDSSDACYWFPLQMLNFYHCFSSVYLSMILCFYACYVISDIIGFQTWSQHHIPGICSNLSWCTIIFIQPSILSLIKYNILFPVRFSRLFFFSFLCLSILSNISNLLTGWNDFQL